jgi:hypothetical protein
MNFTFIVYVNKLQFYYLLSCFILLTVQFCLTSFICVQYGWSRSCFTTDGQPVSMSWYRVPLWDLRPDITSCRNVAVWNLRPCIYWAPSLSPSRAEPVTILYCLIWDSPNLEAQVPVFISPRNKVAQLYPPCFWLPCIYKLWCCTIVDTSITIILFVVSRIHCLFCHFNNNIQHCHLNILVDITNICVS